MQHVCMIIDLAPDIENTNSPTPMADILLAVPAVPPPNPIMAILTAIQAQIAQTDAHLKAIKTSNFRSTADHHNEHNMWGKEYGFNTSIGIEEVSRNAGFDKYCTPEQASALVALQFKKDWVKNAAAYKAYECENKYEEEREYTEEEHKVHWAEEEKDYWMNLSNSTADPIFVCSQDTPAIRTT